MEFIIFFIILFIFSILGLLVYLIYIPIKRRLLRSGKLSSLKSMVINLLYACFIFLISLYASIIAFNPSDGFYKEEFEQNSGIDFPASGKILKKKSWYPDTHGSYWAASSFEISEEEYDSLLNKMLINAQFMIDTSKQGIGCTNDFKIIEADLKRDNFKMTFVHKNKEWFKIAFIDDKKTILFESAP